MKRFWKSIVNELKDIFGVTASIASLVLLVCVLLPLCFILAFTVPIWILPVSIKFWIWIVVVDLPLIYGVILKIRHEDSLAKIMTEAYETSGKPMEQGQFKNTRTYLKRKRRISSSKILLIKSVLNTDRSTASDK